MPKRTRIATDRTVRFITFTVRKFRPIFSNRSAARKLKDVLHFYELRGDYRLHAYVVMPEHVHLLLECTSSRSLGAMVRDIKKYFSYVYRTEFVELIGDQGHFSVEKGFRLWQSGYDEVTISSQKQYNVKLAYILNNPVKRGLVSEVTDYEFCFHADFEGLNRRI